MNDATGRNTARRRRADTIARCERIMETARRLPLTRDVLAEAIERATPVQLDLMESWLDAEIASRERSKRVRLLKAAGFPNAKDIEGYDWSNLRMPADWGRAQLETVFCQIFVGRFGVSFSPFERLFLGRFGFGQSCGLSVIA